MTLSLLALAIVPALIYFIWLIRTDELEPEPLGLVFKAAGLGAIGVIPAYVLEKLLGQLVIFQGQGPLAIILDCFIKIAPIEEASKLVPALLLVWGSLEFNEENDGIVYIGASAIGFATMENIAFVLNGGWLVGAARMFTALPLHTFTGVIMGYYTGLAHFDLTGKAGSLILKGLIISILIHGLYDTLFRLYSYLAIIPIIIGLFVIGSNLSKQGRLLSKRRWGRNFE